MISLLVPTILRAFRWKAGLGSGGVGCTDSTAQLAGTVTSIEVLQGTAQSTVMLAGKVTSEEELC